MIWNHVVWLRGVTAPGVTMKIPLSLLACCCFVAAPFFSSCSEVNLQGLVEAVVAGQGELDTASSDDSSSEDTSTYDSSGVPIYGYQGGRAVYGYDASNQPIYDYRHLTSSSRVPNMRPRPGAPVRYPQGIRKGAPPRHHAGRLDRPHKHGARPHDRRGAKPGARPNDRRGDKPGARPNDRRGGKPGARPHDRKGGKPDARPQGQRGGKPGAPQKP